MGDKIFISYRRDDSRTSTESIYRALLPVFGRDQIFFDVDSIPGGVNFAQMIQKTLAQCAVMLVVVGPKWLDVAQNGVRRLDDPGDYVRLEVKTALDAGLRVIPVLVEEARMPHAEQLPEALRNFALMNARQVRYAPDFDIDIGRLVKAVEEGGAPTLAMRQARAAEAARNARTEAERQRQQAYQQDLARQQAAWQVIQAEQARQAQAAAQQRERRERLARAPLPWRFALLSALAIGIGDALLFYLFEIHYRFPITSSVPNNHQLIDPFYAALLIVSLLTSGMLPGIFAGARYCRIIWEAPADAWSSRVALRMLWRVLRVAGAATILTLLLFFAGGVAGAPMPSSQSDLVGNIVLLVFASLLLGIIYGAITGAGTTLLLLLARGIDVVYARLRQAPLEALPAVRWVRGLAIGGVCGLAVGVVGYFLATTNTGIAIGGLHTADDIALYATAALVPAIVSAIVAQRTAPAILAAAVGTSALLLAQTLGNAAGGLLTVFQAQDSGYYYFVALFALAGAPIGLLAAWVTLLVRGAVAGRRAPGQAKAT